MSGCYVDGKKQHVWCSQQFQSSLLSQSVVKPFAVLGVVEGRVDTMGHRNQLTMLHFLNKETQS